jgi:hypothetical protein
MIPGWVAKKVGVLRRYLEEDYSSITTVMVVMKDASAPSGRWGLLSATASCLPCVQGCICCGEYSWLGFQSANAVCEYLYSQLPTYRSDEGDDGIRAFYKDFASQAADKGWLKERMQPAVTPERLAERPHQRHARRAAGGRAQRPARNSRAAGADAKHRDDDNNSRGF